MLIQGIRLYFFHSSSLCLTLIGAKLKVGHEYFTGDFTTKEREKREGSFSDDPFPGRNCLAVMLAGLGWIFQRLTT